MYSIIKKVRQSIITVVIIFAIICLFQLICTITYTFDLHLYFGWQEVKINDSFSIKVPGNWEKNEKYGLLYFSVPDINDNDNVVFFQSKSDEMFPLGEKAQLNHTTEKNFLSDKFQSIVCLNNETNSLGQTKGDAVISVDDITYSERFVSFDDHANEYLFYTWENVDDKTLDKIADSVSFLKE